MNKLKIISRILVFILATGVAVASEKRPDINWLIQPQTKAFPFSTNIFIPQAGSSFSETPLSGHLLIQSGSEQPYFKVLTDRFKVAQQDRLQIQTLPSIEFDFVQHGDKLIPATRTVVGSDHPNWEWLVSPGTIWQEPGDDDYSRMAFPFALQEKNANCTHNGYLLIVVRPDGKHSSGFTQIGAETCAYLQFDFASQLAVTFSPKVIPERALLIADYLLEEKNRLPVYTGVALNLAYPKLNLQKPSPPHTAGTTTSGLVIKGRHYRLHCQNRYGQDPYCDGLALPSFSTAKSIFAGVALMRMQKKYPGVGNIALNKVIPECDQALWQGVSLNHLLNMRTGNYLTRAAHADEESQRMMDFFLSESADEKLALACGMFPHKAKPGKHFVYHTSDTYLAGIMLNRLYQRFEQKTDIYTGWFATDLWPSLGLSPLLGKAKRTYDVSSQAFTGYGLTYLTDDIIKISQYLYTQLEATQPVLDKTLLANALQRGPVTLNFPTSEPGLSYNNGFWALEVSKALGCKQPKWIPFMSGYGGITVALISPDLLYYNFADDNQYRWLGVVKELQRQFDLCEE